MRAQEATANFQLASRSIANSFFGSSPTNAQGQAIEDFEKREVETPFGQAEEP